MIERKQTLEELRRKPDVSVLIVGGGINGAGLYRDLALQGIDALLIDKADFCSGSSAGSSRMIHGGLRYLEFGEFRLVRESLRDRNLLLKNAPHYVFPLETTIPCFKRFSGAISAGLRFFGLGGSRPTHRGLELVNLGLHFYDFYTRKDRIMPKHSRAGRAKTLKRRPMLDDHLIGSATYYDAWISYPERLGLELLLDAESLCPDVHSLNYMAIESGDGDTAVLHDLLTDETIEVRPKVVVNATGAWIDFVNEDFGCKTQLIGGTKGGHLILDNKDLYKALDGGMVYYETNDGRVSIAFPWLGKCLIGSTDLRIDNPDDARCDENEVDYILESIRQVFPKLKVDRKDIVSRFTGVRPLAWTDPDRPTVTASRDHRCHIQEPTGPLRYPIYSMIGGKWTTFRAFAEQVTDKLLERLGGTRRVDTDNVPIGGGKHFPADDDERQKWIDATADRTGIPAERVDVLLKRYGTRGSKVAAFLSEGDDAPLTNHPGYTKREIEFLIQRERVMHLDDLLMRRTSIGLLGEGTHELLEELADQLARLRELTPEERQAEIDHTRAIMKELNSVEI